MDGGGGLWGLCEAVVFLSYFNDLPDPRQRGKVMYPLDEVLLLALLAVLAGAETFVDIARFGDEEARAAAPVPAVSRWDAVARSPRRYLRHARRRAVPALLRRLGRRADRSAGRGDRHRRQDLAPSYQKKGGKAPIHMVSAFAARQRLVLGQVKVAEKSNEIVAIPKLLDMMAIEGADRDHRRDGLPARHRAKNPRQEGRLRPRAERQPGHAARGCRTLRGRAEEQRLQARRGGSVCLNSSLRCGKWSPAGFRLPRIAAAG